MLLIFGYILGMCIGASFIFGHNRNAEFIGIVFYKNDFCFILFFVFALILKYSGILSGAICTLPVFLGIYNSIDYCSNILNTTERPLYTNILNTLKDTSICFLLILYIIIIIVQISSNKYIINKDLKYLATYLSGTIIICMLKNVLNSFIF